MPHAAPAVSPAEADASLLVHRAVAARLVADPAGVLAEAEANLAQLPADPAVRDRWTGILAAGAEASLHALLSRDADAAELRAHSPFAAILPDAERRAVLS